MKRWGISIVLVVIALLVSREPIRAGGTIDWHWQAGAPTSAILVAPATKFSPQVTTGRWVAATRPLPDFDPAEATAPLTRLDLGVMRGVPLQRLEVHPYRQTKAGIEVLTELTVTVALPDTPTAATNDDPLLMALRRLVLNPDNIPSSPHPSPTTIIGTTFLSPTLQFTLTERGFYALPLAALTALTTTVDPAQVHFTHGDGRPLTATYDTAESRFLFYADPQPTRWVGYELYRVLYGGTAAQMERRSGSPSSLPTGQLFTDASAEENRSYLSIYRGGHNGEPWYWQRLSAPGDATATTFETTLTLATPQTGGASATLTLWLQGETFGEHHLTVAINGHDAGVIVWSGQTATQTLISLPAAWLQTGANRMTLHLEPPSQDIDGVWVDALNLHYPIAAGNGAHLVTGEATPHAYVLGGLSTAPLVLDVTNPDNPQLVTATTFSAGALHFADGATGNRRYFIAPEPRTVPGPLTTPMTMEEPSAADYLAILPQAWITTLQPLLDKRESEGLTTFAAPLQAIYDTYGDGRPSPQAIHDFISHAYHNWTTPPDYVLLVGDGTYDPRHYTGAPTENILPPYLADFDPWLGEAAADNRYVTVDGDDRLPDLTVGRLPANSAAELAAMVTKILTYAVDEPAPGDWPNRHLFVADDRDWAADFPYEAIAITGEVPITQTVIFMQCEDESPFTSDCLNVNELHRRLINIWNGGALVINWVGHSSQQQWEHERLFHTDDLPLLTNTGRLPVVIEMTCFTGDFAQPSPLMSGMAESLVRLPNAGAVADWAVSGGGIATDHTALHRAFYQAAFGGELWLGPGIAATAAKITVAGGSIDYLLDGFHLFGDPAMPWQTAVRPWPQHLYLPLVARGH